MTSYYIVQILDDTTRKAVKEFKPQTSRRQAERLRDGVHINLDHNQLHTRIIEERNGERLTP
jgi:hypothetical protein